MRYLSVETQASLPPPILQFNAKILQNRMQVFKRSQVFYISATNAEVIV